MIDAVKKLIKKWGKDNVGMLASVIAWNALTSIVPIMVGLLAITGLVLRSNPSAENSVISHLSASLQGVLTANDLRALVKASIQHSGLLGIVGFLGVLWGGANIGSAISTAFQAIFETNSRNFIKESFLDMGMIFVIAVLMIVIIAGTTAGTLGNTKLFSGFPLLKSGCLRDRHYRQRYRSLYPVRGHLSGIPQRQGQVPAAKRLEGGAGGCHPIHTALVHLAGVRALRSLQPVRSCAVPRPHAYRLAVLLRHDRVRRRGLVAIGAIGEARQEGEPVGPAPEHTVPQHRVLRDMDGQDTDGTVPQKETRKPRND